MAKGEDGDKSEMGLQQLLLMPPADEQRAIICSLESDTAEESLHVYTVSQAWYERWRAYVGLQQASAQPQCSDAGNEAGTSGQEATVSGSLSTDDAPTKATVSLTAPKRSASADTCQHGKELNAPPPGPIEMDLTDEDNISVDEKVRLLGPITHPPSSSHFRF